MAFYEIFRGCRNETPLWVESADSLPAAFKRMKELAFKTPGPYFVFCADTSKVLATLNTLKDNEIRFEVDNYSENV